jgi:hypothetical protein
VVALLPVYADYQWLGLLFDEILFRGYRRVPVTAPLFVVGVARSGTTALHHALADDPQLTTMRAWECVPPAYAEHLARRHRARSEPRARRERDLRAYGLDDDSVRAAFDPIHHCVDFEARTPMAAAELGPEVNRGEPVPEAA